MQLKHAVVGTLAVGALAQNADLNTTLANNNNTSGLAGLLGQFPQVATALSQLTNVTLLAPSNDAISALTSSPEGQSLASNPGMVQAILTYHVINGTFASQQIPDTTTFVPTALTNESYTNVTGGQRVGVVRRDNGVTVFSGAGMNTTIAQADIQFNGGVVHVINDVLTLPTNLSSTASAAGLSAVAGALVNASLVQPLEAAKDITVFAPNNAAFQAIGSALATVSTQDLANVLAYHVVNGTVGYSSTLQDGANLTTQQGGQVRVSIEDDQIFVNGARVVMPDVLIANGVVHVIDNVLNPANSTAAPAPDATAGAPAFSGASSASDVPFTSAAPTGTAGATGSATAGSTSASTGAAALPMRTGAVGAAALFGAGAAWVNM